MKEAQGLLSRWSRRKLQSDLQRQAEDALKDAEGENGISAAEDSRNTIDQAVGDAEAAGKEPVLTDADMPDIDELTEASDFSGFMSPGVSDELRNLALRKLFNAPSFNIRDGLDEYDEDYTSFEKLGDIVTSDMKHQLEMQAQKSAETADEPAGDPNQQQQTSDIAAESNTATDKSASLSEQSEQAEAHQPSELDPQASASKPNNHEVKPEHEHGTEQP